VVVSWYSNGAATPKPNGDQQFTKHPTQPNPTLEGNAQSGLVPPLMAIILYDFQPTPPANSRSATRTARGPAYNQIILLDAAHSWGRRLARRVGH